MVAKAGAATGLRVAAVREEVSIGYSRPDTQTTETTISVDGFDVHSVVAVKPI